MMKRVLSLILALVMVIGCAPHAFAAVSLTDNSAVEQNELPTTTGVVVETPAEVEQEEAPEQPKEPAQSDLPELTKFEDSGWNRFSESVANQAPKAEDLVTFIVVTEEKPLLEKYSVNEIATQTAAVQSHAAKQETVLNAVKNSVKAAFSKEEGFKLGFTYTIATTGFSVTTAYGNKAQLEAIEGVKSVYVAPTFNLPEDQDFETFTNNAPSMIGANVANATGYTGKGMRIAILDTGLKLDHPNFGALPADVLVDPMTRESVGEIWKELNAGQMTSLLNTSYYNTKVPFAFNYTAGNFNVANTYAGSDHGTHVAGIAAANKIDSSKVVGVAPDAQLVVMQVFQQGGGAAWDTIMAALEDCVRLEVDAANLSLGSAAGFVDPADAMLETMNLFVNSDIQMLIASGNDTNNAYMNAWGLNMSLIENPDIGLAGTPSTYSAAISVASMDNNGFEQLYITVNGKDLGFQDTAATAATNFIQNFRSQELEYVVVPGLGTEEDYEGLDVTGKIALISRGDTSFPEKQATAQAKGAIGCIIYNNDKSIFNMQINDGEGNIPAISVTKASGEYMIAQAGEAGIGTLTVCDADMQLFKTDVMLSDFSSWGVAPDLTLKPEISGVGGSIYSTVDPAISGSNYGMMGGTSMATPQIAGAMAVLIQYLDENYPQITGDLQRRVAANILMSTANPIMATETLEYSPRAQGAGLADLVKATTTPAYLANMDASEGRPKVEFRDDPDKTGVYTFSFQIHNLTNEELTYEISSSVFTETIYNNYFIANSPYALEAEVHTGSPVTVPANGSVTVNASITLTGNDKAYLNQFPNGIYVEGYLYATPVDNAEGVEPVVLSMPMIGFYGDWSDADIFDSEDTSSFSLYPTVVYTYASQVGTNPYFRNGASGDKYNAFSYANPLAEVDFGMLRNAKRMDIKVTDKATGEVYHTLEGSYMAKTFFNPNYGQIIPTYLMIEYGDIWDGKTADGRPLADGTVVTYSFDAWLDDGDDIMDDSFAFDITLDNQSPELLNEDALQQSLRLDTETGRSYLTLEMLDNQYIAALIFMAEDNSVMGKYEVENVPGEAFTGEFEITGFGSEFTIVVADYACNETAVEVLLDLGDQNNAVPEPAELSSDRLYGCETFDGAEVEGGWFSANKADFTDARNETFDSANRYYSAEYVNGYLIAQNANTGHLELVTPAGTYWATTVLAENNGAIGDPNVWVLYDMAMDYSTIGDSIYDPWGDSESTNTLFAVGWLYKGDQNNDGKDDGYNALFRVAVSPWNGYISVEECGRITGTDGAEILTLGITTEGAMYGISTDGKLYTIDPAKAWDDAAGANVIKTSLIGVTDFVNYPGYGGVNVIQSMGYDHNTDTMYWYAHSQVALGYAYQNINVTYTVNLENAKCTEVGSYGEGGQTCLFVPHDIESDMFAMGVNPTGVSMSNWQMFLVETQTERLKLKWDPWNAAPQAATWSSSDESIATVDEYGFVTGIAPGEAVITATTQVWNEWRYDENWNSLGPGWEEKTATCTVTVLPSEQELYGYIMADHGNPANHLTWGTYADNDLHDVTWIGKQYLPTTDMEGNTVDMEPMWAGGTYYNGYVYSVDEGEWEEKGETYVGSRLFRSKVTKGATPAETTIGEPEFVGGTPNVLISAMGFDYNTGRMYVTENRAVGGLGILDLDTGKVDLLGLYNGDLNGAIYVPGLCVTRDGTIVISDAIANLYTIDPDTLTTKMIYDGEGDPNSAYFEAMAYDYNNDVIYWNMCDGNGASPLYMAILGNDEWSGELTATVINLGSVSSKNGTQQTILFAIPDEEPETNFIPVEGIEITNGEKVVGLEGGSLQLNTVTTPARPSIQAKTWTSSDESVVTVDQYGVLTYVGIGKATVTVSIANKNPEDGGPFTDTIEVEVLEAAGDFVAFLTTDEGGSGYFDFWLDGQDYDLVHTSVAESMIAIYSLRCGAYYDGYFYGYNAKGEFMRIAENDPANYKILGTANLDYNSYQVTAMAVDYAAGVMYGLTMPSDYNHATGADEVHPGELVTIDLDTGYMTTVATLDFNTPVFALACDDEGQLYAAGGEFSYFASYTTIYKLDKTTGALTPYTTVQGANVCTGTTYYGDVQYNSQMTYDWGTDRLYLYATADSKSVFNSCGMFMIQLGDEPYSAYLGGISLELRGEVKYGQTALGLLAFIPEADEVPVADVNGIILNTNAIRIALGTDAQLVAQVRPSNALDKDLTWTSSDETIATVDETGLVTGLAEGSVTVTVTNERFGITAEAKITVVDASAPQSVAYTVSASKDALIAFNPNLPAQTAVEVVTMSGGSTIAGMAYGDNCLYYLVNSNYNYYLYRFDFTTKQSSSLGSLSLWTEPTGMAYDAKNNLLYVTAGFYLFQFDASTLVAGGYGNYSNYTMDNDYCSLTGVAVIDGAVYTFGNDYYNSIPQMMKYSDQYLADRTVVLSGYDMNLVPNATDIAYDALSGQFYMTDAGHNIYAMDMAGNVSEIGILGDGIDIHGLAIDSTGKYTITYEDGTGNVLSVNYMVAGDSILSGYYGTPARTGYTFAGWVDAEGNAITAETLVEANTTIYATWTAKEYTITLISFNGEPDTTISVTFGEPIGEALFEPVRKNYTFTGWFLSDGVTQYTPETVYEVDGDLTLYATWKEPDVIFRSVNATLRGDLGLNFYVKMVPSVVNDPETAVHFTVNGKLIVVPMSEAVVSEKDGETRYRFTCTLAAKQMTDKVTAQVVTSEGPVGEAKTMSVADYCSALLAASGSDEKLVAMVNALLNYGAAAQAQFEYNLDDLANAALSEADKVLADVDASAYAYTITGAEDGIKLKSANLGLENEVNLRVHYVLTGDKSIDEYTFLVDGVEVEPVQKGDQYYIQISINRASDMEKLHKFVVGDLVLEYGVLSYVNTALTSSQPETVQNAAKALYAYAMAAKAYFG